MSKHIRRWAAHHAAVVRDAGVVLEAYTQLVQRARALIVALVALVVAATALARAPLAAARWRAALQPGGGPPPGPR